MTQIERKMPENQFLQEESLRKVVLPQDSNKLVDPEDSIATTKEEEWVTKKKIELTTRRQIETRVKRQVVLEDGKVVEDSGPVVTTNTTEDTQKQEHSQTEHRTLGDNENSIENRIAASNRITEIQEKTVKSREESEERTETENVQHLGDISDEGYMTAIKSGSDDVRQALEMSNRKELVESLPKVIHQSMKIKKYIDTEDKTQLSQIQPGGRILNETKTTRLHEELGNYNISDDDSANSQDFYETTKKENRQKYRKTKKEDLTEYLMHGRKIGEKLHFHEETSEAERSGDPLNPTATDNISSRLERIRMRSHNSKLPLENARDDYVDPLRKKTSSFDQEEETRKEETSKWLEHHFGSDSTKSSKGSVGDLDEIVPSKQNSFINVTMKSQLLKRNSKPRFASPSDEKERALGTSVAIDDFSKGSPSPERNYFRGITRWADGRDESDRTSIYRNLPSSNVFPTTGHVRSRPKSNRSPLNGAPPENEPFVSSAVDKIPRFINETRFRSVSSDASDNYSNDHIIRDSNYSGSGVENDRVANGFANGDFECRRIRIETAFNDGESKAEEPSRSTPKAEDEPGASRGPPSGKKFYQRTRFAADIPPPSRPSTKQPPVKQKSKIGESFRKLVSKLRSSSSERKNKKKWKNKESRSPSPAENTYQNYNSLDNNYGSLVTRTGEDAGEEPKRTRWNHVVQPARRYAEADKSVQRYYLGEDPFSGSIYGREKEYDGHVNSTRSTKNQGTMNEVESEDEETDFKSRTLGRLSKSTSRLQNSDSRSDAHGQDGRAVQTLPRKIRDEKARNTSVDGRTITNDDCARDWDERGSGAIDDAAATHAPTSINVSFVNRASPRSRAEAASQGPAKPARTYRSNLSRSQSFNVQPGRRIHVDPYKSNPHLHRLEEPLPPPLESPGMIFRWNQSSNHLDDFESESKDFHETFDAGDPNEPRRINSSLRSLENDEGRNSYGRSKSATRTSDSDRSADAFRSHRYGDDSAQNSFSPAFGQTLRHENDETLGNADFSGREGTRSGSEDRPNPMETSVVKIFGRKSILSDDNYAFREADDMDARSRRNPRNDRSQREEISYGVSPSGVVIRVRSAKN